MFCLVGCHLLLHTIMCKTSMLKFSITLEFLIVHCSKSTKRPLELTQTGLDSARLNSVGVYAPLLAAL